MKFAEMPYQRVDTEAVVAALKELTQELKAAKSGEEQFRDPSEVLCAAMMSIIRRFRSL